MANSPVTIQKKDAATLLASMQVIWPDLASVTWNPDGSAIVTSNVPLTDADKQDLIEYLTSSRIYTSI